MRSRTNSVLNLSVSIFLVLCSACGDEGPDVDLVDAGPSDAAAGGFGGIPTGGKGGNTAGDAGTQDAKVDSSAITDALVGDAATDAGGDAGCGPLLARGAAMFSEPMGSVDVKKADMTKVATLDLDFGFGSAAFHDPKDPEGVFWAVTDRGPNFDCDGNYCNARDKVFAKPTFSPTIVKVTMSRSASPACVLSVAVSNKLPIVDKDGAGVTGLPIAPSYNTEAATNTDQATIPDNDNGMDTEGLVRLDDGTFWLAEEYGPSLVHVDATGKVIERVMPQGVKPAGAVPFAPNYPVTDALPGILVKRKQNRGFESLAISPDGKFLYTALQSPMPHPDKAAGDGSLVIRIHKLSLKGNGEFQKVAGEWLYLLNTETSFVLANATPVKRTDLKLSEMVALGTDDLLVQERTDFVTKIYRIKLDTTTALDEAKWDAVATMPSLETFVATDVAFAGVTPVTKVAVFDGVAYAAANQLPALPNKVEGITVLGDFLVFVNDNDFNAAQKTIVTLLPLPAAAK